MKSNNNSGAALLTAIFFTGFVAVLTTMMIVQQRREIQLLSWQSQNDQMQSYARASKYWADNKIRDAVYANKQHKVYVIKKPVYKKQISNYHVTYGLKDALMYFNINALTDSANIGSFVRLVTILDPDMDLIAVQNLAENISSWMRPSHVDIYYLNLKPPYRASHFLMADISELLLVKGMTKKIYDRIKPYIIALPLNKLIININTAPIAVMASILNITTGKAQQIVGCREQFGYMDNDHMNVCIRQLGLSTQQSKSIMGHVAPNSNYFILQSWVENSGRVLYDKALMHYASFSVSDNKVTTNILYSRYREGKLGMDSGD